MIIPDEQMKRSWPQPVLDAKPLFREYVKAAHSTGMMILDILVEKLGIDPKEITDRHRLEQHSGDHVRMTRGPPRKVAEMPEIQTPSHTDFGT